ncbi:hypothetical protein DFP73DRAFT_568418, partial [Morchella snyderi]
MSLIGLPFNLPRSLLASLLTRSDPWPIETKRQINKKRKRKQKSFAGGPKQKRCRSLLCFDWSWIRYRNKIWGLRRRQHLQTARVGGKVYALITAVDPRSIHTSYIPPIQNKI